jgi:ribonuclease III
MTVVYPRRQQQLQRFARRLGLSDTDPIQWQLLDLALTHPTVSVEYNYDRLEFVGDAVVRMAVAEFLWAHYPALAVGEYTAIRAMLVSDRTLAELAKTYELGSFLLVGGSAIRDVIGEATRLAESFEAVLGALYLSTKTLELVQPWLIPHWQRLAIEVRQDPAYQNYKAALQEWTQAHYKQLPEYRVIEAEHSTDPTQRFTAEVWFRGEQLGQGQGRSIKIAEQEAAKAAFLRLQFKAEPC